MLSLRDEMAAEFGKDFKMSIDEFRRTSPIAWLRKE